MKAFLKKLAKPVLKWIATQLLDALHDRVARVPEEK